MKSSLGLLVLWSSSGFAQAKSATPVLQKLDKNLSGYADQTANIDMFIVEPGGAKRSRKMRLLQKGEKRLINMTAPAELKGMSVLVENTDTTYIYLPAYRRVRRIAGHMRNQGFLGSDFSYDDIGETNFAAKYKGTITKETAEAWHLELAPVSKESAYGRLVMVISKKHMLYTNVEYFDRGGNHIKTQTQSDFKVFAKNSNYFPGLMVMVDHRRGDHRTELALEIIDTDSGIPDSVFTKRSLNRQ